MNPISAITGKIKLGQVIWLFLIVQVCWTLFVVGRDVIFRSKLPLWLNPHYSREEKVSMVLGQHYIQSKNAKDLPLTAGCLMIASDISDLWLVNYYLFPRRLYWHEGIATEEDFKKLSRGWLKERGIEYVIIFNPPDVRVLKINYPKGETG